MVVGLGAQSVVGGPSAGETVKQVLSVQGVTMVASDPSDNITVVTLADGRRAELFAPPEYVLPAGLDTYVVVPAADPLDDVVVSVVVGARCYDAVN